MSETKNNLGTKVFGGFQKFGQALLVPVAILPASGIIYGLGYAIYHEAKPEKKNAAAGILISAAYALLNGLAYAISYLCGIRVAATFAGGIIQENIAIHTNNGFETARKIVDALGGKSNIIGITCCAARLRIHLNGGGMIGSKDEFKKYGSKGIVNYGKTNIQIVIGTQVIIKKPECNMQTGWGI